VRAAAEHRRPIRGISTSVASPSRRRCAGEGLAPEVATFLIVEELGKGYLAHQRARGYPVRESYTVESLPAVLEALVANIEGSPQWPVGAFVVNPHHCRIE